MISIKLLCNFVEIALQHGCSLANLLLIFIIFFPKNTSGWLLLSVSVNWHLLFTNIGDLLKIIVAISCRTSRQEVFLEISQNSQESTCEFCEISKNVFSYRTLPVAASEVVFSGTQDVHLFFINDPFLTLALKIV